MRGVLSNKADSMVGPEDSNCIICAGSDCYTYGLVAFLLALDASISKSI